MVNIHKSYSVTQITLADANIVSILVFSKGGLYVANTIYTVDTNNYYNNLFKFIIESK